MFYDYKGKKYLLNLIDTPVCLHMNSTLAAFRDKKYLDR